MSGRSSAAVESITRVIVYRLSAAGIAGVEPVARIACSNCISTSRCPSAGRRLHPQVMRVDDLGQALHVLNLARLDQLSRSAREPFDDVVLEVAELREIDLRLAELDAPRLRVA